MTHEQPPDDWRDALACVLLAGYLGDKAGPVDGAQARFNAYVQDVAQVGAAEAREMWLDRDAGEDETQQGE